MTTFIFLYFIFCVVLGVYISKTEKKPFYVGFVSSAILTPLISMVLTFIMHYKTTSSIHYKAIYRTYKNQTASEIGMIILILLVFTLPFHYTPFSGNEIIQKEKLSLRNTVITYDDVRDVINRYNSATIYERLLIVDEPLYKVLRKTDAVEITY